MMDDICSECCRSKTVPVAPDEYVLKVSVKPEALISCQSGPGSCQWFQYSAKTVRVGSYLNFYTYCQLSQAQFGSEVCFVVEGVEPADGEFGWVTFTLRPAEPPTHWPHHRPSAQSPALREALEKERQK